ncbi:hypothetical protein VTK73DRAFT_17 [Phialemonium thermophilum]|uniref:SPX domain-containing protein n=1 Tax=Phialemonium thermophilum TaxID=223376 RepID=A0ABR3Y961_9PEZI
MRFGKTLRQSVYPPWKDKYIDYARLKGMLREDDDDRPWTEDDENRFCDEIFNIQLEKVAQFQEQMVGRLRERVDAAMETVKNLTPPAKDQSLEESRPVLRDRLKELEAELDSITNTLKELKKYSNLNYTGFLKIVKKHDRKRGERYRIRPIMQVSLAQRPFNSEQAYSPLLTKLSLMYFAIRQQLDGASGAGADNHLPIDAGLEENPSEVHNGEWYTAHKFWVHPDNLIEVKTFILRRLPALVYSQQSSKEVDGNEDPTITSLYFDSPKFELYSRKVDRQLSSSASSLRLRWYGQLNAKPEILFEQKTVHETTSEERKFTIKDKYVKPFLDGAYKMEKTIQKMERQGRSEAEVQNFKTTVKSIQKFVLEHKLEPVLRANYVRSAFQKPGDDRVRIAIDTNVAFIREDTLDRNRPCRDPRGWHRSDIDGSGMAYPFKNINQSEVSLFPYAILEIKLKEDANRRRPSWVEDLIASHLVHPAPRFSKFVHGVASLFEDYVNMLPFWLSDLETDIRKDPQAAFEEEEQRRAERAESEQVVGSFLGSKIGSSFAPTRNSPVGKSHISERVATESFSSAAARTGHPPIHISRTEVESGPGEEEQREQLQQQPRNYGATVSSVFPSLSLSKYARAKKLTAQEGTLPPGVVEPKEWIKNSGPLQVEPKVWLANERTFLKWQHICILLGGLSVGLYTAGNGNLLIESMGIAYVGIAMFAGGWGYWMHRKRRNMIIQRSGKHFDNMAGPLLISVALVIALVVNFIIAFRATSERLNDGVDEPSNYSLFIDELRLRT